MNLEELNQIKIVALQAAQEAQTAEEIEAVRIAYLSRKGRLPLLMAELKNVPAEEKPLFGKAVNEFIKELTEQIKEKQQHTRSATSAAQFDLTQPGQWHTLGSRHPITQMIDRITSIFQTIGFTVADGPDIESVFHNFDALNTPADHPSRDEQDTFYLKVVSYYVVIQALYKCATCKKTRLPCASSHPGVATVEIPPMRPIVQTFIKSKGSMSMNRFP